MIEIVNFIQDLDGLRARALRFAAERRGRSVARCQEDEARQVSAKGIGSLIAR